MGSARDHRSGLPEGERRQSHGASPSTSATGVVQIGWPGDVLEGERQDGGVFPGDVLDGDRRCGGAV